MSDEDVNLILAEKSVMTTLSENTYWQADDLADFVSSVVN